MNVETGLALTEANEEREESGTWSLFVQSPTHQRGDLVWRTPVQATLRLADKPHQLTATTMIHRKHRGAGISFTAQLLGSDSVDTREYHRHVGDLIRIEPYALFRVDKVLVAISAEKAGVSAHVSARLDPRAKLRLA